MFPPFFVGKSGLSKKAMEMTNNPMFFVQIWTVRFGFSMMVILFRSIIFVWRKIGKIL